MLKLPFTPRLPLVSYQSDYLRDHGHAEAWGLIWDMGTGKTKALIDNAALLACEGKVNGLFVVAPNGVHRNWVTEELPKHWPNDVRPPWSWEWDTAKASGKRYTEDFGRFLSHTSTNDAPGGDIGVLCMSFDGLMTDAGKQASWNFLRKRACFYAADESQRFKDPSSARNKRVFASSAYAPYRRIASGTPMDKPFDIYPQMRFLDEHFWRKTMGIDSFTSFRAHIGNYVKRRLNTGAMIDVLDPDNPYQHLDELQAVLATMTTRLTEEQAGLALPERTWHRVYHALTDEQRSAYEELSEECMTVLSGGELVSAEHVLTMRLRLAQIGAGFVTPSAGAEPIPFRQNPRAEAITELLYRLGPGEATITWCMFRHDYETLLRCSARAGRRAVVYDAARPQDTLEAWKAGEYHDLIGNLGSGLVEGHTLIRARKALYYTNTPRLIARAQSEKRNHRLGQTEPVDYYDFLAEGTLDTPNLESVRRKARFTGETLGDDPEIARGWLRAALRGEEYAGPEKRGRRAQPIPQLDDLQAAFDYEQAMMGS